MKCLTEDPSWCCGCSVEVWRGEKPNRSLFKFQRYLETCSSPPRTADRRRAPGRQLTAGPVLRPAGFSPPPARSLSSGLGVRDHNGVTGSSPPTAAYYRQMAHRRPVAATRTRSTKPQGRRRAARRRAATHRRQNFLPVGSSPPTSRSHPDSEREATMASPASHRRRQYRQEATHRRPVAPTPDSEQEDAMPGGRNADDEQPTLDGGLLPADLSPPADGSESVKSQWRRRRRAGGGGGKDKERKEKKDKRLTLTLAQGVAGALLDGMISSMVVTPKREAPIAVVVVVIEESRRW